MQELESLKEPVDVDPEELVSRKNSLVEAIRQILISVGEDPDREGLDRTPQRIARMYDEILAGYKTDPVALVNEALFEVTYDEMVVVRDITESKNTSTYSGSSSNIELNPPHNAPKFPSIKWYE